MQTKYALMLTVIMALPGPANAQDVDMGAALFMDHCATCHGVEAAGDGPMAGVLLIPPADLTRLSARNAGVFPTVRVATRIDGRDPLVSHGSPMPVYGDFFEGVDVTVKLPTGQPMLTSQPIADLLTWLESVQAE